jgi:NADH dehydrogenase
VKAAAPGSVEVVVVGAGFGGLAAARELARSPSVHVTLLDRRNHHLFQPLLYQVAMAGLSPAEIAAPIRALLSEYPRITVLQGEAQRIDLVGRTVSTDFGTLHWDHLILAPGARTGYFGHPDWEEHAPGLKTIEQATEIRRRVLEAFELAEREPDKDRRRSLLTFVVIGGGPTGVELAGALGEMSRYTLARDFRHIDPALTRIILVEAGPRILAAFAPTLAARAVRDLEALGVQVWVESAVSAVDAEGVTIGNNRIEARTVVWAAGVEAEPLVASLGVPLERGGRVAVGADLRLPGRPEVAVLGDAAAVPGADGRPLPGLAPVALQQGLHAARDTLRMIDGGAPTSFVYRDKGQMATIGRSRAVAETGRLRFGGFLAWLAWLVIHIYYLTGFRNRLIVVFTWAWSYLTFRRGARLIIDKRWRTYPDAVPPKSDAA